MEAAGHLDPSLLNPPTSLSGLLRNTPSPRATGVTTEQVFQVFFE